MEFKWIWITVLVCACTLIEGTELDSTMMMETLPGYAVISSIEQLNATRCRTEMKQFRDAVNHRVLWGLKMLDTSGQPAPGFILGNNFWTGNRRQCESLSQKLPFAYSPKNTKNNSLYRNPADEYPPFALNFFGSYIHHSATIQYHTSTVTEDVIVLGLCLPASCTEHEVATMVTKVLDDRLLLVERLYPMHLKLLKVSNLRGDYTSFFDAKIIVIIIIFAALLGTVITGTLYDVFVVQKQLKESKKYSIEQSKVDGLMDAEKIKLEADVGNEVSQDQERVVMRELNSLSRSEKVLTYFSIYSNFKKIFTLSSTSTEIQTIHGLRVFGTLWIIMAHSTIYNSHIANRGELFIDMNTLPFQIMANATLAVETFFFLGGFVLTVGYLKSQKKARSFRECATYSVNVIITRYIRLTLPHIVTIFIVIVALTYLSNTALIPTVEPVHELCSKHWWQNVLYINNFFEWKNLCMSWTWYISNDMQFFIFGTFLMMLSISHYYASLSLGVAVIIATSLYRAYVTYVTEYVTTFDAKFETLSSMYIRPWMRIQPYLIGMGTALLLDKLNYKLHLSKKALAICWSLSILCNCSIIFGVPSVIKSLDSSVVYETFFKLGWSLGIAWLLVACLTNNGGIINQFLSLPYWVPFSRVSFFAYLVNPVVVLSMHMIGNYSFNHESLNTATVSLGQFVITYIVAFVLSAVCEVPTILMVRAIKSSRIKR